MKLIRAKYFLYFVVIFSITIPFQFNLLKNNLFTDSIESFYKTLGESIFPDTKTDWLFISDSITLYIHIFVVVLLALALSFIPLPPKYSKDKISLALSRYCRYYLSLMLLTYGLNKLFLWQFFAPHPNTVFMPLGQLTKDFLYWTSIGTSTLYNRVTGLIEIIAAISLWYRPTRIFGSLLAWLVLAHVVLINFAFDINVKVQSLFLLFVCSIILAPHIKSMLHFFKGKPSQLQLPVLTKSIGMKIAKSLVIAIIILESFFPYLKPSAWNGNDATKPPHYGAYKISNNNHFKRFFIHSDPYFIVQTTEDEFYSFTMTLTDKEILLSQNEEQSTLTYNIIDGYYFIEGNLFGEPIQWKAETIPFENAPIYNDNFNWFIEDINP